MLDAKSGKTIAITQTRKRARGIANSPWWWKEYGYPPVVKKLNRRFG